MGTVDERVSRGLGKVFRRASLSGGYRQCVSGPLGDLVIKAYLLAGFADSHALDGLSRENWFTRVTSEEQPYRFQQYWSYLDFIQLRGVTNRVS